MRLFAHCNRDRADGALMNDADTRPTLEEVKTHVDALERADRASLRPWMLAHFDDDGNPERGYQPPPMATAT